MRLKKLSSTIKILFFLVLMKGDSNFKGKHHTDATKAELKRERGHEDRVQGRRWRTDKKTGEESRVYKKGSAKRFRWGRSLGEWLEKHLDSDRQSFVIGMMDDRNNYFAGEVVKEAEQWTTRIGFGVAPAGFAQLTFPGHLTDNQVHARITQRLEFPATRFNDLVEAEQSFIDYCSNVILAEDHGGKDVPYFYALVINPQNYLLAELTFQGPFWRTIRISGTIPPHWYDITDQRNMSMDDVKSAITNEYGSSGSTVSFFDDHMEAFRALKRSYTSESYKHNPSMTTGLWAAAYIHSVEQKFQDHPETIPESLHNDSSASAFTLYNRIAKELTESLFANIEDAYTYLDSQHGIQLFEALNHSPLSDIPWLQRDVRLFKLRHTIDEQYIKELTTELLTRYKDKASQDATAADKAGNYKRGNKRFGGIIKATKKQFDNDAKKHQKQ